jgi:hypothetical protein
MYLATVVGMGDTTVIGPFAVTPVIATDTVVHVLVSLLAVTFNVVNQP